MMIAQNVPSLTAVLLRKPSSTDITTLSSHASLVLLLWQRGDKEVSKLALFGWMEKRGSQLITCTFKTLAMSFTR